MLLSSRFFLACSSVFEVFSIFFGWNNPFGGSFVFFRISNWLMNPLTLAPGFVTWVFTDVDTCVAIFCGSACSFPGIACNLWVSGAGLPVNNIL